MVLPQDPSTHATALQVSDPNVINLPAELKTPLGRRAVLAKLPADIAEARQSPLPTAMQKGTRVLISL